MGRQRKPGIRGRIVAVLASLVALWAFAAYVTVGEGINLVWLATLEQQVAKPTESLIAALQAERRESAIRAAQQSQRDSALVDARAVTDAAQLKLRTALQGLAAQWSTSSASDARLADLLSGLDGLAEHRAELDAGRVGRIEAASYFTDMVQLGLDVYDTYTAWDNSTVIYQTSTLVMLTHSQEMISREDALLSGVIAEGRISEADRSAFAELVGAQHYLGKQVSDRLPEPDRAEYQRVQTETIMSRLRALEDSVVHGTSASPPVSDVQIWRSAVNEAINALRELVLRYADRTVERVQPLALGILIRLVLAAGLGLIAVIASIRFTIRSLRSLQDRLASLREAALDLADRQLPDAVERLRLGDPVQPAPPLDFGDDDIGQVGQAFNVVQHTAIQATVDQAELRRGVREVFLSLSHRIQALVHRQLKLIDGMERAATTDSELASLFRIDHLATRMRRNAENLIVLSGVPASRIWRDAIPMVDVIRAALAEVEDYQRIKIRSADAAALSSRAVGDVIHLLAELMENAISFSSPSTAVAATGMSVQSGYLFEIEDRGLGMTDEDLERANQDLAELPEFHLSGAARLGFYVVGRLAHRHGLTVRLRRSQDGGVIAAVLVPAEFVVELPDGEPVLAAVGAEAHATVEVARSTSDARLTPAGLPWRVRAPKPARNEHRVFQEALFPNGRAPEEVGRMMAAFVNAANQARTQDEGADDRD